LLSKLLIPIHMIWFHNPHCRWHWHHISTLVTGLSIKSYTPVWCVN